MVWFNQFSFSTGICNIWLHESFYFSDVMKVALFKWFRSFLSSLFMILYFHNFLSPSYWQISVGWKCTLNNLVQMQSCFADGWHCCHIKLLKVSLCTWQHFQKLHVFFTLLSSEANFNNVKVLFTLLNYHLQSCEVGGIYCVYRTSGGFTGVDKTIYNFSLRTKMEILRGELLEITNNSGLK